MSDLDLFRRRLQAGAVKVSRLIDQYPVGTSKVRGSNSSGDKVEALDRMADSVFLREARSSGIVGFFASEEHESAIPIDEGKKYTLTVDPLDGSQNIGLGMPLGSIFSVWSHAKQTTGEFVLGRLVAAGYALYGPTLTFVWAEDDGVDVYQYDRTSLLFNKVIESLTIGHMGERRPTIAINYLKSRIWRDKELIRDFLRYKGYTHTLRFDGCLVADVHRVLMTGGGFLYPADDNHPDGLLRLDYEVMPMGYIVDKAGGWAHNGYLPVSMLSAEHLHDRTPVFMGDKDTMNYLWMHLHGREHI